MMGYEKWSAICFALCNDGTVVVEQSDRAGKEVERKNDKQYKEL